MDEDVLRDLIAGAEAIGPLARDEDTFRAGMDAWRAADADSFQRLLGELEILDRCELVCGWLCSKDAVLECIELCGPPPVEVPSLREFAQILIRITADEELVERLAEAVEERDPEGFKGLVDELKIQPFCHLLCHWVCMVRCRITCGLVCPPREATPRLHLEDELTRAGQAIRTLAANEEAMAQVEKGLLAGDCDLIRSGIGIAKVLESCEWICEWLCSWRCIWLCVDLCRVFEIREFDTSLSEAYGFAQATASLGANPGALGRLVEAVDQRNVESFAGLVKELQLERFCIQLSHWLCYWVCGWFCRCVCPPVECAITDPTGCTEEEPDPVAGILFVRVQGTASGGGFGHYTLDIQKDGDPPIAGVVSYPGGGVTGTAPVVGGELGRINTTALSDGAYTITLTVFPAGAGSSAICVQTFNLLKVAVYITSVAGVSAVPNCFDENAELVSGGDIKSFGGALHLDGSAYVYDCASRRIERYELRQARVTAPGPGPGQPPNDTPVPADWPVANQLHTPLVYDPSKYYPWTRVGEIPANLINDWGTIHIGPPSPGGTDYPILVYTSWDSRGATGNPGGGRYALLLIVEDTAGHRYFDLQRIWVDNWPVLCQMVKFQKPSADGGWEDIPPCTDILLSWKKLRIIGLAWDSLIDTAWPATPPNDNFDHYGLSYQKEFVGFANSIPITPTADHPSLGPGVRVPDLLTPTPTAADADLLAEWDLSTLDAGASPTGDCDAALPVGSENELYRGCSCTYTLALGVSDTTETETVFDYNLHHPSTSEPIKIVNDL